MPIVIPAPIVKPFCNTGDKNLPPITPSTIVQNQETGIPPLQATKLGSGGIPVSREEFNGTMNFYTQQIQALVSGAQFTFDAAVSLANGGYPEGIVLYCASNNSYQKSLIANNTNDFVSMPSFINDGINWSAVTIDDIYAKKAILKNNGALQLNNLADTFGVTIRAYPSMSANYDYAWPENFPSEFPNAMTSGPSGGMGWIRLRDTRITFSQNPQVSVAALGVLTFNAFYSGVYYSSAPPTSLYDPTTGVFTAPTSGTYKIELVLLTVSLSPAPDLTISIFDAGTGNFLGAILNLQTGGAQPVSSGFFYLNLTGGQTIHLKTGVAISYGGTPFGASQFSVSWYAE